MSFWNRLTGTRPNHAGETPNANPNTSVGPSGWNPGDPNGLEVSTPDPVLNRGFGTLSPSPWSGLPAEWSTAFQSYDLRLSSLVDTAWAALDRSTMILSSMPAYRVRGGKALPPTAWMNMPAPVVYASWAEFAKQLFWDFKLGEAFVLALGRGSSGYPAALRVVPPWLVQFEQGEYRIPGLGDVTGDLLHIRYSRGSGWRGCGPLESAGARVTAAGLLMKYQADYLQSGGIPRYTLETDRPLTQAQTTQLLEEWRASRGGADPFDPAVLTGGVSLKTVTQPSPKDSTLMELSQFNEARIAILLGMPPFMLGLPSGGDSMTYSNVTSLFDYHFRASLRPEANMVMTALSNWALPYGQSVELNGDAYTQPTFTERADAYVKLVAAGVLTTEEVRAMERFGADDDADVTAVSALTGGEE